MEDQDPSPPRPATDNTPEQRRCFAPSWQAHFSALTTIGKKHFPLMVAASMVVNGGCTVPPSHALKLGSSAKNGDPGTEVAIYPLPTSSTSTLENVVTQNSFPVIIADSDDIFPDGWRPEITFASGAAAIGAVSAIKIALNYYQGDRFRAAIEKIYVIKNLRILGVDAIGVSSKNTAYIATHEMWIRLPKEEIVKTLHHEIAGILFANYPELFDEQEWKAANRPEFAYGGGSLAWVRAGHIGQDYEESLLPDGFIFDYSRASLKVDFMCISRELFTGSEVLWDAYKRYHAIQEKVDLTIRFYNRLDPGHTVEFFRSLVKRRVFLP